LDLWIFLEAATTKNIRIDQYTGNNPSPSPSQTFHYLNKKKR